jgi:hypothetical protein
MESPTETTNNTVPADNPPNKMPARLLTKSTGEPISPVAGKRPTAGE